MREFTAGQIATLACIREVSASKPGNVHRGADFEDVTFEDFLTSAVILGHVIDCPANQRVGQAILAAAQMTKSVVGSNTNLGMILLIVPMAIAYANQSNLLPPGSQTPEGQPFNSKRVTELLADLNAEDCRLVYEAIALTAPGGLGTVPEADVAAKPPDDLIAAMGLAAKNDLVAAQYANGFNDVFEFVIPTLSHASRVLEDESSAIIVSHVQTMARYPDSLIARKCGSNIAQQSALLAEKALSKWKDRETQPDKSFWNEVGELDFWLRCDGHRRNPGTTADLIAAGLFAGMAGGFLPLR